MQSLRNFFSDADGNLSSKRLFSAIALMTLVGGIIFDTICQRRLNENLANLLMFIVSAGLGTSVAERWSPKKVP